MYRKSDNVETMSGTNSFFKRYQEGLQTKMWGSSFTFERADLLNYHLHEISLNRGGSYINSPEWLKSKRATINPKNDDGECFKYALTAALHYEEIRRNPQRITKIMPFNNTYHWTDIMFPSHSNDWKKFEQNNKSILIYFLYHTIINK